MIKNTMAARLHLLYGMKRLIAALSFSVLLAGGAAVAQTAGQDMKDAGHAAKEAAKDTGKATEKTAKTTGKKVKHGTKKAVNKSADATEKAASKVKDKTDNDK